MYEPNIKLTTEITNHISGIEAIQELLKKIPFLPIIEEQIKEQALVETVYYTALIEGNRLDANTVELLNKQRKSPKPKMNRDEREILNLYNVMDFIRDIAKQDNVAIGENVIKQIHAFVVRDIPEQGTPGYYRVGQNAVVDSTTRKPIYMPPPVVNIAALMNDLGELLSLPKPPFHPIILAGIAHLQLVAVHPFDDGNGRTARALADLILDRYGYGFRYLFSWVYQIGIDMNAYHRTIRQVLGEEYTEDHDTTVWLEYFTEVVKKALDQKEPELRKIQEMFVKAYNLGSEKGLSKDQVEAVIFADFYDSVTSGEYMRATGLSRGTVVKRLNELVDLGVLTIVGKGRGVEYKLTLSTESINATELVEMKK